MKKLILYLVVIPVFASCKTLVPKNSGQGVLKIWDKIHYPHQEIVNGEVSQSLLEVLTETELSTLENWRNKIPPLQDFLQAECVGCSDQISSLKPVYRVEKEKFIHFGLQNGLGVENWVFKKRGAFVTRFFMFQGESQKEIREALKDIQSIPYVLEGVYPIKIDAKYIYLEHVAFEHPSEMNNQWYQPMFPTKIGYEINLTEKSPELRFKIGGGLYSYQKPDENGTHQIINFVEPLVYANAVDIDEPMSYSSFADAFYANATFFLLDLEEGAEVSIRIESKTAEKDYKFSVLKNDGFYTMEEYLQKEGTLFDHYQNTMSKGNYLVRILHENTDYAERPLYTVYINKKNLGK